MPFIILVAFIALSVAAAAAYFSIYGLALIFSGAIIPVIIMASTLEVGKLCATSIVYNYWDRISILMRTYYILAIFVLMLITSGGIYGFLSAAYQQDKLPLEQMNQRLELLNDEFQRKSDRLAQMDQIIASIGANFITKRLEEKAQQQAERDSLTARLEVIEQERLSIANDRIEQQAHIGPVIYMAEVFGTSTDQATNVIILLFIFVFDPLAVALTLSVNMLLKIRREKLDIEDNSPKLAVEAGIKSLEKSTHTITAENDISIDFPSFIVPVNNQRETVDMKPKPQPVTIDTNDITELDGYVEAQQQDKINRLQLARQMSKQMDEVQEFMKNIAEVQPIDGSIMTDLLKSMKRSEGELSKLSTKINDISIPPPHPTQPVAQTPIQPNSNPKADERLERRRNLVKQIRNPEK
jgi:hypothetical protein